MKKSIARLVLCFLTLTGVSAQKVHQHQLDAQVGYGFVESSKIECITPTQREIIQHQLTHNVDSLTTLGILPRKSVNSRQGTLVTTLNWPLRKASGFTDLDYHGISNYIDRNPTFNNNLQDYNCGTRTYDLSNYNHAGTDIFTWPYGFLKMNNNQVEIIAAAAGTIVYKADGNFDKNCSFGSGNWNAVYVQHADGSTAWYGHMKNGSQTSKAVGQSVTTGEYLGVVGSSGNSTGPHLHFELYDASNTLVDPWNGACNSTPTWWANQRPYNDSKINKLSTHAITAVFPTCPATETPNEQTTFGCGNLIYFYAFYHDEVRNQTSQYRILKPDGSTYSQWTRTFTQADWYAASYWYYTLTLPSNAVSGTWKYQITYQGTTYETSFTVNCTIPVELSDFRAKLTNDNRSQLIWETKTEINADYFEVQKSLDGANWQSIERVKATGGNSGTPQYYTVFDAKIADGANYYRLEQVDLDGKKTLSKVVNVVFDKEPTHINVSPNPIGNGYLTIDIQSRERENNWTIDVFSVEGKLLERSAALCLNGCKTLIHFEHLPSGVYFIKMTNGKNSFLRKVVK
jgi:murein DD-endopeptidase MepM/ murein hydrolase activator NlpD